MVILLTIVKLHLTTVTSKTKRKH